MLNVNQINFFINLTKRSIKKEYVTAYKGTVRKHKKKP